MRKYNYFWDLFPTVQNFENILAAPLTNFLFKSDDIGIDEDIYSPNFDTIYGAVLLDLRNNLYLTLKYPEINRYYSFQFLDLHCNEIICINSKNNYSNNKKLIISNDMKNDVFLPGKLGICIIRIYADFSDINDINFVKKLINQIDIDGNQNYNPFFQIEYISSLIKDYKNFNKLLNKCKNSPVDVNYLVNSYEKIIYYQPSNYSSQLLSNIRNTNFEDLEDNLNYGQQYIKYVLEKPRNNWILISSDNRIENEDILLSFAAIQWQALYVHNSNNALYFYIKYDINFEKLNGEKLYIMELDKIPYYESSSPESTKFNGFWSIIAYNTDGLCKHGNNEKKFVGSLKIPVKNSNNNYTIILSYNKPRNVHINNWLPVPKEDFYLIFRIYLPNKKYFPTPIFPHIL